MSSHKKLPQNITTRWRIALRFALGIICVIAGVRAIILSTEPFYSKWLIPAGIVGVLVGAGTLTIAGAGLLQRKKSSSK